jgi:ribosome maturation factor RimP
MTQTASQPSTPQAPTGVPGAVEHARGLMLEAVIEPVLATLGYELVHLEWSATGRQRKLQVFVDREGGIDLDDCARLSPILGNALDAAEAADTPASAGPAGPTHDGELARLLASAYVLEVSSPGLERPLSRRSHYARFLGRLCRVRVFSPLEPGASQRNFHGRIEAVTPDPQAPHDDRSGTVTLRDPDGGLEHHIPIDRVRRARLVYEDPRTPQEAVRSRPAAAQEG